MLRAVRVEAGILRVGAAATRLALAEPAATRLVDVDAPARRRVLVLAAPVVLATRFARGFVTRLRSVVWEF